MGFFETGDVILEVFNLSLKLVLLLDRALQIGLGGKKQLKLLSYFDFAALYLDTVVLSLPRLGIPPTLGRKKSD